MMWVYSELGVQKWTIMACHKMSETVYVVAYSLQNQTTYDFFLNPNSDQGS